MADGFVRSGLLRPDWSDPINEGLAAWWPMLEGVSDKAWDISGNNNHGTLTNEPVWDSEGLKLDGTDDYIRVPNAESLRFDDTDTITLLGFVEPAQITWYGTFMVKGRDTDIDEANYAFRQDVSGKKFEFYYNESGSTSFHQWASTSNIFTVANRRYHVAITYTFGTGSSLIAYVDGASISGSWASGTGNAAPDLSTQDLLIGKHGVSEPFSGVLSDVRIFNRILSEAEIQRIYLNPNAGLWVPDTKQYYVPAASVTVSPTNLLFAESLSSPAITQNHIISIDNLLDADALSSPSLTQNHILSNDNLLDASSLTTPSLTQNHVLAVSNLLFTNAFSTPSLTQNHILPISNLNLATLLSSPSLNTGSVTTLSPNNLSFALSITSPALTTIFSDQRDFVEKLQLLAPYDINAEFIAWVETNFSILKEGIELLKTLNVEGLNTISGAIGGTHKMVVFDPTTNEPKLITKSDFLL